MIAHLNGTVAAIGTTWVVLDVNGVGYKAFCPPSTVGDARPSQTLMLHTSMVVREDSMTLYGFSSDDQRECFDLAMGASGVGPKTALAMMSVLTPDQFVTAITTDDHKTIARTPGIGPKTAQKLVLELKDKVKGRAAVTDLTAPAVSTAVWREQVGQGLQGLGWSAKDAEAACDRVAPLAETEDSVAVLMRAALQSLAR